MELIGNLKDKIEKAQSKKEAQNIIENAGIRLTEDEMDKISGGFIFNSADIYGTDPMHPIDY